MNLREGLLVTTLLATLAAYGWMFWASSGAVRASLGLVSVAFVAGTAVVFWQARRRLTPRVASAHLALGAIVHLGTGGLVVVAHQLWTLGWAPAIEAHFTTFALGVLGMGGALLTWSKARQRGDGVPVVSAHDGVEPPPPKTPELTESLDFAPLAAGLPEDDQQAVGQLRVLERIDAAIGAGDIAGARRIVRQEALRLCDEADARQKEAREDDVLTQAASLLEWGAQKLPELAELDVSDLLMAKAIADARAKASRVERRFVDHRQLRAIHPIDRATADQKCDERAQEARDALPLLQANGMRLSEELLASSEQLASFRSVTGFQVVQLEDGSFVTFEGNGRREALARAFGEDQGVQVEVRQYVFDDPADERAIQRRMERVRRWKKVSD